MKKKLLSLLTVFFIVLGLVTGSVSKVNAVEMSSEGHIELSLAENDEGNFNVEVENKTPYEFTSIEGTAKIPAEIQNNPQEEDFDWQVKQLGAGETVKVVNPENDEPIELRLNDVGFLNDSVIMLDEFEEIEQELTYEILTQLEGETYTIEIKITQVKLKVASGMVVFDDLMDLESNVTQELSENTNESNSNAEVTDNEEAADGENDEETDKNSSDNAPDNSVSEDNDESDVNDENGAGDETSKDDSDNDDEASSDEDDYDNSDNGDESGNNGDSETDLPEPEEEPEPENLVLLTGHARNGEELLANTAIEIIRDGEIVRTVTTDESGYFYVHLNSGDNYSLIAEDQMEIDVTPYPEGKHELTFNQGELALGKNIKDKYGELTYAPNVIYLADEKPAFAFSEGLDSFLFDNDRTFVEGDIVILPPFNEYYNGVAVKVEGIEFVEDYQVISITSPALTELIDYADISFGEDGISITDMDIFTIPEIDVSKVEIPHQHEGEMSPFRAYNADSPALDIQYGVQLEYTITFSNDGWEEIGATPEKAYISLNGKDYEVSNSIGGFLDRKGTFSLGEEDDKFGKFTFGKIVDEPVRNELVVTMKDIIFGNIGFDFKYDSSETDSLYINQWFNLSNFKETEFSGEFELEHKFKIPAVYRTPFVVLKPVVDFSLELAGKVGLTEESQIVYGEEYHGLVDVVVGWLNNLNGSPIASSSYFYDSNLDYLEMILNGEIKFGLEGTLGLHDIVGIETTPYFKLMGEMGLQLDEIYGQLSVLLGIESRLGVLANRDEFEEAIKNHMLSANPEELSKFYDDVLGYLSLEHVMESEELLLYYNELIHEELEDLASVDETGNLLTKVKILGLDGNTISLPNPIDGVDTRWEEDGYYLNIDLNQVSKTESQELKLVRMTSGGFLENLFKNLPYATEYNVFVNQVNAIPDYVEVELGKTIHEQFESDWILPVPNHTDYRYEVYGVPESLKSELRLLSGRPEAGDVGEHDVIVVRIELLRGDDTGMPDNYIFDGQEYKLRRKEQHNYYIDYVNLKIVDPKKIYLIDELLETPLLKEAESEIKEDEPLKVNEEASEELPEVLETETVVTEDSTESESEVDETKNPVDQNAAETEGNNAAVEETKEVDAAVEEIEEDSEENYSEMEIIDSVGVETIQSEEPYEEDKHPMEEPVTVD